SHSCPSPSLHPTPTALYTLSLHDALPISSSATTPTPIGSSGASCACRRRSSNREHKPTRPLVPQIPDTPGALCPCPHSARGDARLRLPRFLEQLQQDRPPARDARAVHVRPMAV